LTKEDEIELVVQINGKVRDKIAVEPGISREEAKNKAMQSEQVQKWLQDKQVVKEIFVPDKLLNIVIK
jgi:leucyl-tRNA synthetase